MNVLITGGAGFIASHLVDSLLHAGHQVSVVDNLSTGNYDYLPPNAELFQTNILDEQLDRAFMACRPQIVFHHAAQIDVQTSMKKPDFDAMTNIVGTLKVLECCRKYGVKKIVYASSAAVYGVPELLPITEDHRKKPISFYGVSKFSPERYIELFSDLYGLDYTILRYSNVYGIRQDPKGEGGVISSFLSKLLLRENPTIFGDGEQTRDFIYVKDVVSANIAAITKGYRGTYNISCNSQLSVNRLLQLMCSIMDRPFEPQYESPREGDIIHSRLDNTKAIHDLRWRPSHDIESGLTETINYYLHRS